MKDLLFKSLSTRHVNATGSEEPKRHKILVGFDPYKLSRKLLYVALGFFAMNLLVIVIRFGLGIQNHIENIFFSNFDMDSEFNLPTLYSFTILIIASALLLFISTIKSEKGARIYWRVLSGLFLFLALDEALEIHERFNVLSKYISFGKSGLFSYPWIFAYSVFALAAAIFFLKFLFRLPKKTRVLFIVSGIAYCFSTMGFEIPESYVLNKYGVNAIFKILGSVEEIMEMLSIILFIYALLDYIKSYSFKMSYTLPAEE